MQARLVLALALALAAAACAPEAADTAPGGARPAEDAAAAVAGDDLSVAQALLDRGDVPAAVEPLRKAAESDESYDLDREEIELLLAQARAATSEQFVEARIAEMRDEPFADYVERGRLTTVPFFHDERIDAYFRKVILAKRPEAREIRERVRAARRQG